jgi:hypothetical protein
MVFWWLSIKRKLQRFPVRPVLDTDAITASTPTISEVLECLPHPEAVAWDAVGAFRWVCSIIPTASSAATVEHEAAFGNASEIVAN